MCIRDSATAVKLLSAWARPVGEPLVPTVTRARLLAVLQRRGMPAPSTQRIVTTPRVTELDTAAPLPLTTLTEPLFRKVVTLFVAAATEPKLGAVIGACTV